MTTTSTAPGISADVRDDHDTVRPLVLPLGVGSLVLALFFEWSRSDSVGEAASMTGLAVVTAALVFGLVVPRGLRQDSAGGRAVAMGLIGILVVLPAFWSQLPLLLGVGAMLLGYAGKRASQGAGTAIAGLVLGTLSVLAYLAIFIGDWIAHPGASWLAG